MIRKILSSVVYSILFFVGLSFLILNAYYYRIYFETNYSQPLNYRLRYDLFHILSDKEFSFLIYGLTLVVFTFLLYRVITYYRTRNSEFDSSSVVQKASLFEKKQGTIRVEYNRNGEITRTTYLCIIDQFFNPIKKIQNKIIDYYNLGYTKKWNTIKKYDYEEREEEK